MSPMWILFLLAQVYRKQIFRLFKFTFIKSKNITFLLEREKLLRFGLFCFKIKKSKFPIFDQQPWTKETCKISDFFKSMC